jgi:thymidylate kinase
MLKLFVIRGNSGSGKTSLARLLQNKLGSGTLLLSQDTIRREMLNTPDGPDAPAAELLEQLLQWGGQHADAVILEGILPAEWYGSVFDTAAETFDKIYAYYYDLPFEETLRRHALSPHAADFSEPEMRRWFRPRDLIGSIPETILTADVSLESAAERIISDAAKDGEETFEQEDRDAYIQFIEGELYEWEQYELNQAETPIRQGSLSEKEVEETRRLLGYTDPALIYPKEADKDASSAPGKTEE